MSGSQREDSELRVASPESLAIKKIVRIIVKQILFYLILNKQPSFIKIPTNWGLKPRFLHIYIYTQTTKS